MPTDQQIAKAVEAVKKLCPDARIHRVGPEGVTFVYPDSTPSDVNWEQRPFEAR